MSASLVVLIPLVLLGLVTALGFVGCVLPRGGISVPNPLGPYEGDTVLVEPSVVACWPLNDPTGSTTAQDVGPNHFNGTYNGSVTLAQPGIVPGDVPNGATTASTCAFFNGGFVSVPFALALNPGDFTLEAWVQPNWTTADPQVQRAVLISATAAGAGYGLFARPDNFWEVQIGTGGGNFFSVKATQPIQLNAVPSQNPVNYLAVTFDNTTLALTLFVGTVGGALTPFPGTLMNNFVPEDASTATPLFIGMGRPDIAGGMFPFSGFIQDVAIYKAALSGTTIGEHFKNGTGA